jgi:toxin FitB
VSDFHYLLDINVISEGLKPSPNPTVMPWMDNTPANNLYLSVITMGEIIRGMTKQAGTKRGVELEAWFEKTLIPSFEARILPLQEAQMRIWGKEYARAAARGFTPPILDSLLAATAIEQGLILVTRNTKDLGVLPVTLLNPWTE